MKVYSLWQRVESVWYLCAAYPDKITVQVIADEFDKADEWVITENEIPEPDDHSGDATDMMEVPEP